LRPGAAILCYTARAVCVFATDSLLLISVGSAVSLMMLIALPHKKLKTGVLPISLFVMATFLTNTIFHPGKVVLALGYLSVTDEGLRIGALRALRVFLLTAGAKFLSTVTTLEEMLKALGRFLRPLGRAGIPVENFFETLALTARILPHVMKKISALYYERMSYSKTKGLRARVEFVVQFLLPFFFESVTNPESLAAEFEEQGVPSRETSDRDAVQET